MRRFVPLLLTGALALSAPAPLVAQSTPAQPQGAETQEEPALLVADKVFITPERKLVAEGNVEAFQGDIKLSAQRVTYDRETGQLTLEGPIRIDQGGQTTLLADSGQLDSGIQNGLLIGARMVFDQQVQIASVQAKRAAGRYTQFSKVSATSCHVCANGKPPLWQIRARRVTHDQLEQQLYFEGAQLRVLDYPVFYFPYLRLPDPTLDRATGFLVPSIRSTSQLGTGVQVPYFIKLGDHKDLTLTPYVSGNTTTLGYRYRQAFVNGRIQLDGAYTRDDIQPDQDRGYLFANGWFNLKNDYRLTFQVQTASDDAYLVDYGLPDPDRLRSELSLERIKRDTAFKTSLIHYKTLRESENQDEIPSRVFDLNYEKRFFPGALGGEVRLAFIGHAHERTSDADIVGRDIARATFDAEWLRSWTFASGLRADVTLGASVDTFNIRHDSNFPSQVTRSTPRAALTLRYPMTRREQSGAVQFLEPIAQIGWTHVSDTDVPNDESTFQEFDQGNLLALSRFPAEDQREDGATGVVGLNWARYGAGGWQALATVGQVFRADADPNFTLTSGLQGTSSDLLIAGQIQTNNGWSLGGRGLIDSDFSFVKAELRGAWTNEVARISGSYIWQEPDPAENIVDEISEIWLVGRYQVDQNWLTNAQARYDLGQSEPIRLGLGVTYRNECVQVNMSVSRRFTSTSTIEPSTEFGFTLSLTGYSVESGGKTYKRTCS
ncbi:MULTISPECIES: LPS assembly protein LptD [unclassified Ruegeria]|uniref:LPS assembly protein LptD n=1 Tax=unclassified Ruegeria TaxID=2625375 RepID=UPI00148879B6|nr:MULTISPECIES: LPS assembly protein LptD [unclassified Ruegeria]NOD78043.1 LPS assembly protein LptD [Ruegeria sp. HKCCD4332]NOD87627.1 LPS assembly protein LptD [Ruegeria sp. HKCCD4318]NOE15660.1 LPS assembly protein LptD [Ruegeria sp. HKCCD4318-2]NOG08649.1 LPS-assembly protein LptD [Ruegeria sp. HKCCD4315]